MIPPWARAKLIRTAFLAGIVYANGASIDEVERSCHITLGETGAQPKVRDALKNRLISGHRYADVGAWQVSLVHRIRSVLGASRLGQEMVVRDLLDVRRAAPLMIERLRGQSTFRAEAGVRDAVGVDGRTLREISDVVMVQVRAIDAAPTMDLTGVVLAD